MSKEISILSLLLLLQSNPLPVSGNSAEPNCLPGYKQGTELAFTEDPGNLAVTCTNAFVELSCCVKGYNSIKWYKKRQGTWKEMQLNSLRFYQENDRNQTLTLQNPIVMVDAGSYMCRAENDTSHLNNTFSLEIRDCSTHSLPPKIILPRKKVIWHPLNSNVSIRCIGFFGTNYRKINAMVLWGRKRLQGNTTQWWIPKFPTMYPNDTNVNITYSETAAHIISAIHIFNITEKDYGNYTCRLLSSINNTQWTVELKQGNGTAALVDDRWKYGLICVMTILALLVLAALLLHCFLLDIKLFYRDRFAKAVNDGKKFDALVVCNNNDKNDRDFVVEKLYKVLEEQYGYKLFIEERNALGGVPEANAWLMRANSSRCIIFVMSPALLEEQWVDYVYFSTAKEIETPKIFIIHQPVQDSDWKNYQVAFKKTFQMAKRKIKWPQDKLSKTGNGTLKDKSAPSTLTGKISKSDNLSLRADTSLNDKLSATDKSPSSPMIMNNHNSSSSDSPKKSKEESWKRQHISRKEDKFWKKIRLALPKPMSISNNITFYKSQDSVSSLTPNTSPKLSSALDASHV